MSQEDKLAQVEIDARGNTQVSLEAYVLVETLADKLAELKVLTPNETLAHIKARGCPHTLTYKQVEVESKTTRATVT